ncbi:spn-E, partial [Symbiodinium microadriaticum]
FGDNALRDEHGYACPAVAGIRHGHGAELEQGCPATTVCSRGVEAPLPIFAGCTVRLDLGPCAFQGSGGRPWIFVFSSEGLLHWEKFVEIIFSIRYEHSFAGGCFAPSCRSVEDDSLSISMENWQWQGAEADPLLLEELIQIEVDSGWLRCIASLEDVRKILAQEGNEHGAFRLSDCG